MDWKIEAGIALALIICTILVWTLWFPKVRAESVSAAAALQTFMNKGSEQRKKDLTDYKIPHPHINKSNETIAIEKKYGDAEIAELTKLRTAASKAGLIQFGVGALGSVGIILSYVAVDIAVGDRRSQTNA
jgi:hypothetical protein